MLVVGSRVATMVDGATYGLRDPLRPPGPGLIDQGPPHPEKMGAGPAGAFAFVVGGRSGHPLAARRTTVLVHHVPFTHARIRRWLFLAVRWSLVVVATLAVCFPHGHRSTAWFVWRTRVHPAATNAWMALA